MSENYLISVAIVRVTAFTAVATELKFAVSTSFAITKSTIATAVAIVRALEFAMGRQEFVAKLLDFVVEEESPKSG